MTRLTRPALRDILDAIAGVESATHGKSFEEFQNDWLLRRAVERAIEIISEAARRIPADLQATQPETPWLQIMGIGNVLRHEYHRTSDAIIWNVVKDRLQPLKAAVVAIDGALPEEE